MAADPFIIDVTAAEFDIQVIKASHQAPVVVDFWAAWCGPCKMLMPLLTALAEQYAGQFILAKVNIDEQPELATKFGVRSVPTVKILRFGNVVDEFLGVQPEPQIRAIIDRYIERESDREMAAAVDRFAAGERTEAITAVRQICSAEPNNRRAQLLLAEMLVGAGEYAEASERINSLPADLRMSSEVQALAARLEFGEMADNAPPAKELEARLTQNPADSEARYQLGSRRLVDGDYQGALEAFLELLSRDRRYGDDAGRKGMLKVFDMLGNDELVNQYRRKMARFLY